MKWWPAILAAVLALGALPGRAAVESGQPHWREIAWPFPRDGWPAGRAFRCEGACGGVELYVRPKLGFCNCDRGVADDDEIDRVGDLDLITPRFAPLQAGEPIRVADLPGRARAYDLRMPDETRHVAVGIAVSHRCDVLVAVAQGPAAAGDVQRLRRPCWRRTKFGAGCARPCNCPERCLPSPARACIMWQSFASAGSPS